ncbi:hypothetical protein [Paenibacillus planticolens]|uniref:Uncharacterized protein n=1 Tax=Paenibacillus planticolens TaxID=2654976 RepID=A0ABX1ZGA9_9BACL|nr:hypothetical protein [Paenibacillus planticolens]NOU98707.1 hypothetical protein [Paenibacillus planticolens]
MIWHAWSIDRILILFVSLAFLALGIQVTMFHYRQNFHNKSMWVPVISAPIFFIAGMILTWCNVGWLHSLFSVLMWLGVLFGLVGFFFHFRGVGIRVDGWSLSNFLKGPPIMLPLLFSAMSVLGLIAMYWEVS